MRSLLFSRVQRLVDSDWSLILALFWGLSEALFWPILPDFYLFAVVPVRPGRWWRLAGFAALGSIVGGVIGYWLAYPRQSSFPLEYMPLVTEGMIHQAGMWLASEGPLAVLRQPLSGIPYKVFVYLSGAGRVPFFDYLLASVVARAPRIFLVAAAGALLGFATKERWLAKAYDIFLILFTLVFVVGLRAVIERFPPP